VKQLNFNTLRLKITHSKTTKMKLFLMLLAIPILFACNKEEIQITPDTQSNPENYEYQHAGLIEFNIHRGSEVEHIKWYLDTITTGSIIVEDSLGNQDQMQYHENNSRRSIGFRFFDKKGLEGALNLTESLTGSTNGISLMLLDEPWFMLHKDVTIPDCNGIFFNVSITSPNSASFSADYIYDQPNEEAVKITGGTYIRY